MNKKKRLLWILVAFAVGTGVFLGSVKWQTCLKRTVILTSVSPDSQYQLEIFQIGDPDWPYGATHCRAVLNCSGHTVAGQALSLQNDGAVAQEDNFVIAWQENGVSVLVCASEQADTEYFLPFP